MRDEVFDAVTRRVPYLSVSRTTDGDDWVSSAALIADPVDTVRNTKLGFGTDDDAVAASLFTEAYAFRVAGVGPRRVRTRSPRPRCHARRDAAVRIDKPRPSAVAHLSPRSGPRLRATLAARARSAGTSGRSSCRPRTRSPSVNDCSGETSPPRARSRSARSVERRRPGAHEPADRIRRVPRNRGSRARHFTTLVGHEDQGWYWDRTSCCLWFRTAEAATVLRQLHAVRRSRSRFSSRRRCRRRAG